MIQLTGAGVPQIATGREPVDPGILTNVSVFAPNLGYSMGQIFASIDITPPGQPAYLASIHLADGYIVAGHPLTWFGFLSIDSSTELLLTARGSWTSNIIAQTKRLTMTNPQELSRYVKSILK